MLPFIYNHCSVMRTALSWASKIYNPVRNRASATDVLMAPAKISIYLVIQTLFSDMVEGSLMYLGGSCLARPPKKPKSLKRAAACNSLKETVLLFQHMSCKWRLRPQSNLSKERNPCQVLWLLSSFLNSYHHLAHHYHFHSCLENWSGSEVSLLVLIKQRMQKR